MILVARSFAWFCRSFFIVLLYPDPICTYSFLPVVFGVQAGAVHWEFFQISETLPFSFPPSIYFGYLIFFFPRFDHVILFYKDFSFHFPSLSTPFPIVSFFSILPQLILQYADLSSYHARSMDLHS